ncbi:MAG: preprotein translocase subunit SecG [Aureispira sp.]
MALLSMISIAFISVLLILVILIQNPKGGGLNASLGSSAGTNQLLGAASASDLLERVTWGLAFALLGLCLLTGIIIY